jgi:hypothetical protein
MLGAVHTQLGCTARPLGRPQCGSRLDAKWLNRQHFPRPLPLGHDAADRAALNDHRGCQRWPPSCSRARPRPSRSAPREGRPHRSRSQAPRGLWAGTRSSPTTCSAGPSSAPRRAGADRHQTPRPAASCPACPPPSATAAELTDALPAPRARTQGVGFQQLLRALVDAAAGGERASRQALAPLLGRFFFFEELPPDLVLHLAPLFQARTPSLEEGGGRRGEGGRAGGAWT